MALSFGRKDNNDNETKSELNPNLNIHQEEIPDKDKFDIKEIEEIKKISKRLDSDEKVEIVAKQSKLRPGGSHTTPDTIFVTNKRLLIRGSFIFWSKRRFRVHYI